MPHEQAMSSSFSSSSHTSSWVPVPSILPPPYRPPPYHKPGESPPYRWPPPIDPVPLFFKALIFVTTFMANYIHLQWTIKAPRKKWYWTTFQLIIAFLMPTLAMAQALISLFTTVLQLLRVQRAEFYGMLKDWRRYFCSAAGMYIIPDPNAEAEVSEGEAQQGQTGENEKVFKVAKVDSSADLKHHTRPWNFQAVLRSILVVLAIPLPILIGLIFEHSGRWPNRSLDRRITSATMGNVSSSICSLLILVSRSEWSLVHLTTSAPEQENRYRSFVVAMFIGGLFNELPINPFSFRTSQSLIQIMLAIFFFYGGGGVLLILLIFIFWCSLYRKEIVDRSRINWSTVANLILTLLCIWVFVDLISALVDDINFVIHGYN